MEQPITERRGHREPWNKGKLVGQKAPLRLKEIWAIRLRLQLGARTRELALFNLAVDSKLRSCDLVKLRVRDVTHGAHRRPRDRHAAEDPASGAVRSHRANSRIHCSLDPVFGPAPGGLPVPEPPASLPASVDTAVRADRPSGGCGRSGSTRPLMEPIPCDARSSRTKNLRAVQLLLGHSKLESTVRYLGIEVDDALEMAEQTEVQGRSPVSGRFTVADRPGPVHHPTDLTARNRTFRRPARM